MDITIEEEASLPLPKNWIRVHKHDGTTFYKSTVTVVEADEHPYIVQALNAARKCVLPQGWVINETTSGDGRNDYYYCNPTLGLSMWDPPSLRSCLADCLRAAGFKAAAERILSQIPDGAHVDETDQIDVLKTQTPVPLANDIAVTYQQFRLQQQMLSSQGDAAAQVAQSERNRKLQQEQNQQWISLRPEENRFGSGPINAQPVKRSAEETHVTIDTTRHTAPPPPPVDDNSEATDQFQGQDESAPNHKPKMPVYVERDASKPTLDELTQDGTGTAHLNPDNLLMVENDDDDDDDDYSSSEASSDESTDSEGVDRQHAELAATQVDKMISPESGKWENACVFLFSIFYFLFSVRFEF